MDDLFSSRLEQRRRALEDGFDLLGWTFDPLDTDVAHLSIARLGAIVERIRPDDHRLIADWWIRGQHVERRLSNAGKLTLYERDAAEAPVIRRGEASLTGRSTRPSHLWVEIALQADSEWREFTRDVFVTYLNGDYRIVDFIVDNPNRAARYLLARKDEKSDRV